MVVIWSEKLHHKVVEARVWAFTARQAFPLPDHDLGS